ncbi:HNH endonuclease [Litoribacter populi]|uniref:HNH endonuclease n=1 Tax=Litoribacter populi TaxID=2598460 RepID=UPI00117FD50E|nr:HNH endonuclease [Litoribacter populi]
MIFKSLSKYLHALTSLKRGSTKIGLAPHKPVLLMVFLEMVEKGMIVENRVSVDAELVGSFQDMWELLVPTLHQADFTQPFYYLQNDKADKKPFWQLVPKPGYSINSHIKSVNTLQEVLDYGCFADDLYQLMQDQVSRELLRQSLLDTYFPETKERYQQFRVKGRKGYVQELEDYILNEPIVPLKRIKIGVEEEVYVRNGLFKKLVPKVYQNTCSFTGMKLTSTYGFNFVDACHIIPFSVSQDDRVTNGLSLCPNLHRAFDRGMVSIDGDYRILVSDQLVEEEGHPYSLEQLRGQRIQLPEDRKYFPSLENLGWHRERVFKR